MKKFLDVFEKITNKVCYGVSFLSMLCIAFMMFFMTLDVFLSLLFNYRILGGYELCQVALLITVFSSWAYTQSEHGHIHVVMFINMMPRWLRFICFGVTSLISTATMVYASIGVYNGVLDKLKAGDATANLLIPFWPLYVIELIAFVLLVFCLLKDTLKALVAIGSQEMAEEIQKTWA